MRFLVDFIQKSFKNESFLHLCGNRKLPDFGLGMQAENIKYCETIVYQTHLVPRKQNPEPTGVLFFSPSGVESYLSNNSIGNSWCFCIGNTTASAVAQHTNRITIPKSPNINLVIAQAAKHFRK
jgi:uroporphyrinogen-III synthase